MRSHVALVVIAVRRLPREAVDPVELCRAIALLVAR